MQYWESMLTKWGFDDGTTVPDGVEVYRDVYLKTVNRLAEKHGSSQRFVPYDRDGIHNPCLVVLVPCDWFKTSYLPSQAGNERWQSADDDALDRVEIPLGQMDEEMRTALAEAHDRDIDLFVEVTTTVGLAFEDFLDDLYSDPGDANDAAETAEAVPPATEPATQPAEEPASQPAEEPASQPAESPNDETMTKLE